MTWQIKYRINIKLILPSNTPSPHHLRHSRGREPLRPRFTWLARRFHPREDRLLSIRIRRLTRGSVSLLPDSNLMFRLFSEHLSIFLRLCGDDLYDCVSLENQHCLSITFVFPAGRTHRLPVLNHPLEQSANMTIAEQAPPLRQQTHMFPTPAHQYQARKQPSQITSNGPTSHTTSADNPPTARAPGPATLRS